LTAKRKATGDAERAEEAKEQEYIAKGEVMDCGCCYETVTIPKMTYCNGEDPHFFCLDCAQKNANNDIGNSQYKLCCMDFSGCKATFSREQRLRFLDDKTIGKLERLQQQEEIRLAELDNLCTCPFCDFAAICPPIEEDREFRCHNPHCEEVGWSSSWTINASS
jgi:TRIAD3 protein (E3 ubiquitin-protein ligase RNF216)